MEKKKRFLSVRSIETGGEKFPAKRENFFLTLKRANPLSKKNPDPRKNPENSKKKRVPQQKKRIPQRKSEDSGKNKGQAKHQTPLAFFGDGEDGTLHEGLGVARNTTVPVSLDT